MSKYLTHAVTASALIAVALAFALPVRAQEGTAPPKPKRHQFTGTIESVQTNANTVVVKQKEESKTFKVTGQTKYSTADKKEAALSDLKVGDKVTVIYTEGEGGALIAHKIAPPAEKKPKEKKD